MQTMQAIKVNQIHATLPASDMERAKRWYADKFGWRPAMEREDGMLYDIDGSNLFIYPSRVAGTNKATAATFVVDDARQTADQLRRNGIELKQYDLPNVTWEDGLARMELGDQQVHAAWIHDSEGNIIAFGEFPTR